jgi:hypothetical protein
MTTLDDVIEIKGYSGDPYLEELEHQINSTHAVLKDHTSNLS